MSSPLLAQQKSAAVFDSYEWDFGQLNAAYGSVCHTFKMKNTSKTGISIAKAVNSCECVWADYPTEVVMPGEEARVMVVFSPATSQGKTFRSVELLDANGRTLGALTVKADVHNMPSDVNKAKYPYLNTALSFEERVENLISLLTPEEKVGLMMNKSVSIDRLGIPSYNWWSEACHGVRQSDYTVFPSPSAWRQPSIRNRSSTCSRLSATKHAPTGTVRTTTCSTFRWGRRTIRAIPS